MQRRFCHSLKRLQQVPPLPHTISCGSISHGTPLRRTKGIPVSAERSGTVGLPPFGLRRFLGSVRLPPTTHL